MRTTSCDEYRTLSKPLHIFVNRYILMKEHLSGGFYLVIGMVHYRVSSAHHEK